MHLIRFHRFVPLQFHQMVSGSQTLFADGGKGMLSPSLHLEQLVQLGRSRKSDGQWSLSKGCAWVEVCAGCAVGERVMKLLNRQVC